MKLVKSIAGFVRVRVESAEPAQFLSLLNQYGIQLYDIAFIDQLTVDFTIHAGELSKVINIADRRGERLDLQSRGGLLHTAKKALNRPVLIAGVLLVLFLSVFLPSRILFVEVEGNRETADKLIIEQAAQAGVGFGASRSSVRSEKLKNTLLGELPQLQWAGVNTRGCVAVITVRERDPEPMDPMEAPVSHLIAERDGVIQSMTVSSGTPLCQIGQAVEKGQVLVSGYTDCGIAIKAQRAEAEIFALTNRNVVAKALTSRSLRGGVSRQERRYRIILGKKQINLWKDSGISDATCVKMYKESYLTLPGGFALPVGVGVEYLNYYDTCNIETDDCSKPECLSEWAERYLLSHMVCGQIISRKLEVVQKDGIRQLSAKYECLEMIGSNRDEELIDNYGEKR